MIVWWFDLDCENWQNDESASVSKADQLTCRRMETCGLIINLDHVSSMYNTRAFKPSVHLTFTCFPAATCQNPLPLIYKRVEMPASAAAQRAPIRMTGLTAEPCSIADKQPVTCPHCSSQFVNQSVLEIHMQRCPSTEEDKNTGRGRGQGRGRCTGQVCNVGGNEWWPGC